MLGTSVGEGRFEGSHSVRRVVRPAGAKEELKWERCCVSHVNPFGADAEGYPNGIWMVESSVF